jgi:predicted Rossmann fold nucleotide-binding protein DprA/Smf involved in DNA uptake
MEEEAIFYHAVATRAAGNYAWVLRAKRGFLNWKDAYENSFGNESVAAAKTAWEKLREQNIDLILREDERFPLLLACGLANIYPKNNEALAERIIARGGAIISEYPPDMPAYPSRFLERNRIVSGLSKGTLVIEAPERSGSLATARFALEQNRDVFVIPGPIAHPNFKGSHELIRQGAELVTKIEHVLAAEGVLKEDKKTLDEAELTPEEALIVRFLAECGAAQDIDKISEAAKLQPHITNQTVSFLLIKGILREEMDGYVIN